MKKIVILSLFLIVSFFSYSDVIWNGEEQKISIIYKVVDPIIVQIENPPQKITVSSGQKNFTYSEMAKDKRMISVRVNAPYNQNNIDNLLRAIYERVYFSLQNNGSFELKSATDPTSIIQGNGYFVDPAAGIVATSKQTSYNQEFANSVGGTNFYTTTQIDADFTMPQENMPMGIYSGTLRLDVWFGGSLN